MGNLRRSHLIAYNSIMAVGWGGACVFLLQHLLTTGTLEGGDAAGLTQVRTCLDSKPGTCAIVIFSHDYIYSCLIVE